MLCCSCARHEGIRVEQGIAPLILNLATRREVGGQLYEPPAFTT